MSAPVPPGAMPPSGAMPPPGAMPQPGAMPPPGGAHEVRQHGDPSVGELIKSVTRDLSTLMRQELALAKAELTQEAATTGKAAGALGGAGVAAFLVVLFLSIALWSGLSNVMDAGWAGLLVAVLWAVVAAVLFVVGRSTLRRVRPTPERTVETLGTVPEALRGQRGGTA
ncbi:MAG: phage holin family protein [Pseudonocardiales bacterium]|nr:phage holin family protein [Pseudonocardiales bacterium]